MFDIVQWNCRGLRTSVEELRLLIRTHDPGVVCLQETKLGDTDFNPGLNYSFYNKSPTLAVRAKGGAAIIVKKNIQHSKINIRTDFQAVAVRVFLNKPYTVCSLYLPESTIREIDLKNLLDQLPTPFLLLGDFNGHNPLWGGNHVDPKGGIIEKLIENNSISLLNDGSMTYHNIHEGNYSAIDLSICSSNILLDFTWSVDEELHGSDHYPIFLKGVENRPSETTPKWKVEEAEWSKYNKEMSLEKEFESFDNHIEAYNFFVGKMIESGIKCIPKTQGNPKRPAVPWWNKTCAALRRVTRKCFRRYKTSGSHVAKTTYLRNQAKQRRYFKKAKRDSWIYYINGINSKTPSSKIWKKIKKLSGKFVPSPLPSLKINDVIITDPNEVAAKFGEHFSNISNPNKYSPKFQRIRNSRTIPNFTSNNEESYNAPFTIRELRDALSSTESTAPGEDDIIYEMLNHLPESSNKFLLKIINKIWDTGIHPKSWKTATIIPVAKPDKDPHQATSYRPISLTSCVCKLMEKMINTRLVWFLEKNNCLSPVQFGFRKNRSTLDPLLRLSNHIQQGFANGKQTIGMFFDLEKAYDTTCRSGILNDFVNMGIRGNMMKFIKEFLTDRFIKVKVGSSLSSPFSQIEGVPQGSILSVTCFSVAINKIVEAVSPPVRCSLFVDDLAIYVSGSDAVSACRDLQKSVDAVSKWADNNGFKFSTTKTVAVRFTRTRRVEEVPTLTLNGSIIPYEKQVKFLGVVFDEKLTWGPHIDSLEIKVKRSLNILKVVSSFDWGADRKSLLKIYNSVCRSKLDYACQIYSSACKTKLQKLDRVHNLGLRICTGAFRTSPVESIYVDSNQLPLALRREELGLRYVHRLRSSVDNPAISVFRQCDSSRFARPLSSKPFQIRLNEEVEDQNLISQKVVEKGHMKVPPWLIPEPICCDKTVSRKNKSEEEIQAKFLAHESSHSKQEKIYTDGSKYPDGVGCAVAHRNEIFQARLPNSASILTAELTAIIHALKIASRSKKRDFVIFSDSYSAISALKKYNSFHPLVQEAQEWLFLIHSKFKTVCFCWVPAHVGILGNELVDREAKEAAFFPSINSKAIPHQDLKCTVRSYIVEKWQRRWSSPSLLNNKKYKKIRESVSFWPSSYHSKPRYEKMLSRLRIGHTRMTHEYLFKKDEPPPMCDNCRCFLTVEHILVECEVFSRERRNCHLDGKGLKDILGSNVDVDNVMAFLNNIGIFYDI